MLKTTFTPGGYATTFPGGSISHYNNPVASDGGQSALVSAPGQFANAMGNAYGSMAGGMAATGKSFADSFGAYTAGLANLGQQRNNEESNRRSAAAMAEAARQGAVGNIGSAALSSYGSAANTALAAWAANQQSYNQALQNMHAADQQGMSAYGTGRNNALASLAGQYGGLGRAQLGADALSSMDFGGGGQRMSAAGPEGQVASGSYFAGGSPRRMPSGGDSGALGGLNAVRGDLMSQDVMDRMTGASRFGADRLDAQHYSSRAQPTQMMNDALNGLLSLGAPAYGESRRGMDQFYGSLGPGSSSLLEGLRGDIKSGYGAVNQNLGYTGRTIADGGRSAMDELRGMWDRSLGKTNPFQSQTDKLREQAEAKDFLKRRREEERRGSSSRNTWG